MGADGQVVVGPDDDGLDLESDDELDAEPPAVEPPAAPTPPTEPTREQLLDMVGKLQGAVKRNNGELAKRRQVANLMKTLGITDMAAWLQERGIDPATGQPIVPAAPSAAPTPEPVAEPELEGADDDDELEPEAAEDEPPAPANEVLVRALRSSAVEAALKDARFSGTLDRAMRVMAADGSLDAVYVDPATGVVTGAAEAVQALREELPEWFRRMGPAGPAASPPERQRPGVDAGDRRAAPPRARGWDQQVNDRLSGRGRR